MESFYTVTLLSDFKNRYFEYLYKYNMYPFDYLMCV
jgi:hypothetical protein